MTLIGLGIENAAQELRNAGTDKRPKWQPRYSMKQLLDPAFRLPVKTDEDAGDISALQNVHGLKVDEVR